MLRFRASSWPLYSPCLPEQAPRGLLSLAAGCLPVPQGGPTAHCVAGPCRARLHVKTPRFSESQGQSPAHVLLAKEVLGWSPQACPHSGASLSLECEQK